MIDTRLAVREVDASIPTRVIGNGVFAIAIPGRYGINVDKLISTDRFIKKTITCGMHLPVAIIIR